MNPKHWSQKSPPEPILIETFFPPNQFLSGAGCSSQAWHGGGAASSENEKAFSETGGLSQRMGGGEELFQRKVGFLKERRAVSERMVFSKKKGQSLRKKAFSEKELCFLREGNFLREMRAFSEKE